MRPPDQRIASSGGSSTIGRGESHTDKETHHSQFRRPNRFHQRHRAVERTCTDTRDRGTPGSPPTLQRCCPRRLAAATNAETNQTVQKTAQRATRSTHQRTLGSLAKVPVDEHLGGRVAGLTTSGAWPAGLATSRRQRRGSASDGRVSVQRAPARARSTKPAAVWPHPSKYDGPDRTLQVVSRSSCFPRAPCRTWAVENAVILV